MTLAEARREGYETAILRVRALAAGCEDRDRAMAIADMLAERSPERTYSQVMESAESEAAVLDAHAAHLFHFIDRRSTGPLSKVACQQARETLYVLLEALDEARRAGDKVRITPTAPYPPCKVTLNGEVVDSDPIRVLAYLRARKNDLDGTGSPLRLFVYEDMAKFLESEGHIQLVDWQMGVRGGGWLVKVTPEPAEPVVPLAYRDWCPRVGPKGRSRCLQGCYTREQCYYERA